MGAIFLGTIIYIIIFVVAAYFICDHVTKDVSDAAVKKEYRQ